MYHRPASQLISIDSCHSLQGPIDLKPRHLQIGDGRRELVGSVLVDSLQSHFNESEIKNESNEHVKGIPDRMF